MDPATAHLALQLVSAAKKTLDSADLQNTVRSIKSAVDDIDDAVDVIGMQLADEVAIEMRSGFDHLEAAVRAADDQLRLDELGHARQLFTRMANRPGGVTYRGTSDALSSDEVSALGHFGNYHYFLLRGEQDQALIAAYRCTEQLPALGMQLFPPALFSRDYFTAVKSAEGRHVELHNDYRRAVRAYDLERRRYRHRYLRERAWRFPAAAGAFVACLAAGAVSPGLAAKAPMTAMGILGTLPYVPQPTAPSKPPLGHSEEAQSLLKDLAAEASQWRQAVEGGLGSVGL